MAVIFALVTSALYGSSDFFGGVAAKRDPLARVMLWTNLIGLAAVAIAAPFLADRIVAADLLIGAVAGVTGMVGLLLLYWALSTGPMAVVAPLSGVMAALVPVLWGVAFGDEGLSAIVVTGIVIGLGAVVATSWPTKADRDLTAPPVTAPLVLAALFAGCCFGSLLLLYDATENDGAPWPVVSGRVVTVTLLLVFSLVAKRQLSAGPSLRFAALAGLGDTFANVTMLYAAGAAVGSRELSVVGVIVAFYPAATVLWARFMLGERLGPIRLAGLALAVVAVALMTLG